MTSMRRTIARNTSIVVFVVVAGLCLGGFMFLRSVQVQAFEDSIENDLRVIANGVKVWTDGDIYTELGPTLLPDFATNGSRAYVVRDATGTVQIDQSDSLASGNVGLAAVSGANTAEIKWRTDTGPNGQSAAVATRILPAQWGWDLDDRTISVPQAVRDTIVQITVARDRASLDASLRTAAFTGVLITLAAAIAAGVAVWLSSARAFRPLNALANRASEIDAPTDTAPFDADVPEELWPIADRLNNLLARLQDASVSERRFTADAAHELRTPIAELRTLTDVALAFPDDPDRLESVVRTSNELSIRLSSLVDALLGIARRETVRRDLKTDEVDILALLQRILEDNDADIARRRLQISYDGPETHTVNTDAALLTSILTNLVSNAVAHSAAGATIRLHFSGGKQGFRLDISNPASNLEPADADMLFEPFWRKTGSHSDRSHSGLGLTLSKSFADILGLQLSASLLRSGDLQLTLASE